MRRALAITLALFVVLLGVALVRYTPPPPVPRDAPRERFSAERARVAQERVVGDGATRTVGTPGNTRARDVIVAELGRIGWTVETQRAMSCTRHGSCAPVANVVASLPGREPALPGVLVTAHYDSVSVSPGASDDGVGTATVLETARALAEGPRPRRSVIVVVTDGEEAGLLGADAFVRGHALAATVRTTINLDSRGSHGPSFMFETSRGNEWLVSLMAAHLDRPVTTSLFYEVYKRMPNDTDFTVTKTIASGLNFANTAGIEHYHTPLDALDVADLGTLQHHGDHVLGMTRAFADAEIGVRTDASTDAVWFDVFAFGIVRWPASLSLPLALIALALLFGQAIRARLFDRGLVSFLALIPGIVATLVLGWGLKAVGAMPAVWIAHPAPSLVSLHAIAAASVLGVTFVFARRSTPRAMWTGTWLGWGVLGAFSAAFAPGVSYLFVVPTMAAALVGSLPFNVACVVPATLAATLLLPLATVLYDALGFALPPLVALPTLLLATTLAPMLVGLPRTFARWMPAGLVAIAIAEGLVALGKPKFTASRPQRANVVFRQDDGVARVFVDTTWGKSRWGEAPSAMLEAIGTPTRRDAALPWMLPSPFAEVPSLEQAPPTASVLSSSDDAGRRHVRARLRSQRGASTLTVLFPIGRHVEVKVEGHTAMPRQVSAGAVLGLLAVPAEGVMLDFDAAGTGSIPITLFDRTLGVPAGTKADAAVRARPREAVPSQDGDVTVFTRQVSL